MMVVFHRSQFYAHPYFLFILMTCQMLLIFIKRSFLLAIQPYPVRISKCYKDTLHKTVKDIYQYLDLNTNTKANS